MQMQQACKPRSLEDTLIQINDSPGRFTEDIFATKNLEDENTTTKAMIMRIIPGESEDSGSEGNSVLEKTLWSRVKGIIG